MRIGWKCRTLEIWVGWKPNWCLDHTKPLTSPFSHSSAKHFHCCRFFWHPSNNGEQYSDKPAKVCDSDKDNSAWEIRGRTECRKNCYSSATLVSKNSKDWITSYNWMQMASMKDTCMLGILSLFSRFIRSCERIEKMRCKLYIN